MRVLHLTYWYPNKEKIHEGIFIKNHIDGLDAFCKNDYYHIQVKENPAFFSKEKNASASIYYTRFARYYKVQEWLTFWMLFNLFFIKRKHKGCDIINFHIATPLCRYLNFFNFFLGKKIVITEHWSAYHRFFGLPENSRGLQRMKRIFYKKAHLIAVSDALAQDIIRFSGNSNLSYSIVPNSVDTDLFHYSTTNQPTKLQLFMATNWSSVKNPFPIIRAIQSLSTKQDIELRIGGDGALLDKMKAEVEKLNLSQQVLFLGRLEPAEMASEFQKSHAFICASNYETFSVVCVEALCCGCPVIATNIPAITEYLSPDSGILVDEFEQQLSDEESTERWKNAIQKSLENQSYNRKAISEKFSARFNRSAVSEMYYNTLKELHQKE